MFSTIELEELFDELWPINRSITGNGVRKTLQILGKHIELRTTEIPSGATVFDWTVPKEWNATDAYIITPSGNKIADFKENNLHLLGYSIPFEGELTWEELKPHLYTLPDQPEAIPYITSYYKERWGFCLDNNTFKNLEEKGTYRVVIKSTLEMGSLTYADAIIKGKSKKEIVFSSYVCHPSLASNELSGPLIMTLLYDKIKSLPDRNYTYRFIFAPETIGTIAYLSNNHEYLKENTVAGYVVTCAGDDGPFTYKKNRENGAYINKITEHILSKSGKKFEVIPFIPIGSDERQYCSPGINLPFGSLMRTMYGKYPEYHTSLDNKSFISFDAMIETVDLYFDLVKAFELDGRYKNNSPYGEPQLGKRGLYPDVGTKEKKGDTLRKILYILNYSDDKHTLLDIAKLLDCSILELEDAINQLTEKKLLTKSI